MDARANGGVLSRIQGGEVAWMRGSRALPRAAWRAGPPKAPSPHLSPRHLRKMLRSLAIAAAAAVVVAQGQNTDAVNEFGSATITWFV